MKQYQAETVTQLNLMVGDRVQLESLRQAVVPPYIMLMPFLTLPDEIQLERQTVLDEEGVHGCTYELLVKAPCHDVMELGFRDLKSGEITHQKRIEIRVLETPS